MPVKLGEETIGVSTPPVNFTRRQPDMRGGAFVVSALDALQKSLAKRGSEDSENAGEIAAQKLLNTHVKNFRDSVSQMEEEGSLNESSLKSLVAKSKLDFTESLSSIPSKYWDKAGSRFDYAVKTQDERFTVSKQGMFVTTYDVLTGETKVTANDKQAIGVAAHTEALAALDPMIRADYQATVAANGGGVAGMQAADKKYADVLSTKLAIAVDKIGTDHRQGMINAITTEATYDYEVDRPSLIASQQNWVRDFNARAGKYIEQAKAGKIPAEQLATEYRRVSLSEFKNSQLYMDLKGKYRKGDDEIEKWYKDSIDTNAKIIEESSKKKVDQNTLDLLTIDKKMQQTSMWMDMPVSLKRYLTLQENVQGILVAEALARDKSGAGLTRLYTEMMGGDLRASSILKDIDMAERDTSYQYNPEEGTRLDDKVDPYNSAMNKAMWHLVNSFKADGDPQYVMNPVKAVELYFRVKNSRYYEAVPADQRVNFENAFLAVQKAARKNTKAREIFEESVGKYSSMRNNMFEDQ